MATTSTIGTSSRNYSTIASWLAAFAAGGWIGECYNDSEFTAGCNFSGHSTSATDYIELSTGTGQSYRDNASVQTNAFAYDQSKGVGVRQNTYTGVVFTINEDYVTIKYLQIAQIHSGGGLVVSNNLNPSSNCVLDSLIMEQSSTGAGFGAQMRQGIVRNCLLIMRHATAKDGWSCDYGSATYANVTTVRPSNFSAGGIGFRAANGNTIKNCAVFGFTTFNTGSPSGSNNASDVTIGFGTSNQASKTYANQFVTTTDTGRDFKVKDTSADLYDTAATDTTNIPAAIDAVGTARPQSTAWDIGAWELLASSPDVTVAITGVAATAAVGSVAPSTAVGITGVSGTGAAGTVGIAKDGSVAITGVQATGQVGSVSVSGGDTGTQGGHFLPLTEKQLRDLHKKERKERQAADAREEARKADAASIAESIRESLNPKVAGVAVKPAEISVDISEDDEDEADLEFLLLNS